MAGDLGNMLDVGSLDVRREIVDPHILDHTVTKRRSAAMANSSGGRKAPHSANASSCD